MYDNVHLSFSEDGRDLLEQLEDLRLEAYLDTAGVWTIGIGHTLNVKKGDTITEEQAYELLHADLKRYERAVNRNVKVALSQRQYDALVIFCFNIGTKAFADSTLVRLLNAGDYHGAEDQFHRWIYSGGKITQGLINRRDAEARLFNLGIFTE